MGQSQEPIIYDRTLLQSLDNALSTSRIAPYLTRAHGDHAFAYQLYLWNARLAKSFLYPLGVLEVTVRNAMHQALSNTFGTHDWVLEPLTYYKYFNSKTMGSHNSSKNRLLNAKGGISPTADEMVAGLNFDFWSNLLRSEYNILWAEGNALANAFPQIKNPNQTTVRNKISDINHFRNRVAHHEPIHDLDLKAQLALLEEVIKFICPVTAKWMKSCVTVQQTLRAVPSSLSTLPGPQLSSTNIRPPMVVDIKSTVIALLSIIADQRPQVALTYRGDSKPELITLTQVASFLAREAAENDHAILIEKETIENLLAHCEPIIVDEIESTCTTGDAIAKFFPKGKSLNKRPQFILVKSENTIVGVIQNPIVKY